MGSFRVYRLIVYFLLILNSIFYKDNQKIKYVLNFS
jgi:hypothetical protein